MSSGERKGRHILYLIGLHLSNRINNLACRRTNPRVYPLDVVVSGCPTMPGQYRSAAMGSSGSRLSRKGELGRPQARAVRIEARCRPYTKVGGRGRGGGNGRVGARFTYSPAQVCCDFSLSDCFAGLGVNSPGFPVSSPRECGDFWANLPLAAVFGSVGGEQLSIGALIPPIHGAVRVAGG